MDKDNILRKQMHEAPFITSADISEGLAEAGLKKSETVFVHSSLSSFGRVAGGADTVIEALLEAVGSSGTVVMPAFTWGYFHDREKAVFSVTDSPVKSEVGIIPETFRRRNGVKRSVHVCHSVSALGPDAEYVMGEGVKSFGEGSSFDRLYKLGSRYLFLGVGFKCCTAFHMVEEFMQVPYRYYRDFRGHKVILPGGEVLISRAVEFLRRDGYYNDFKRAGTALLEAGVVSCSKVGRADIMSARIRDIFHVTEKRMEKDAGFLLDDNSRNLLEELQKKSGRIK